jgi:hypothetical protein
MNTSESGLLYEKIQKYITWINRNIKDFILRGTKNIYANYSMKDAIAGSVALKWLDLTCF